MTYATKMKKLQKEKALMEAEYKKEKKLFDAKMQLQALKKKRAKIGGGSFGSKVWRGLGTASENYSRNQQKKSKSSSSAGLWGGDNLGLNTSGLDFGQNLQPPMMAKKKKMSQMEKDFWGM